ncbi:MAG: 2-oxoacid:ferredoxin oxidoreductase subunit beta, partial [Euryarchaeota archaeon]|nr:2-oxoacid:ferredoxin oxidoreductase subunit beta [Euryarchaeota archaeon]
MEDFFDLYRKDRWPTIFCPGCGIGTVMNCFYRAFSELELDQDKVVFVSGVGCSSRIPGYIRADSIHTTHGRALAVATGINLSRPDLKVIVFTGDGDLGAIGGNHFIHASRR